MLRKIFIYLLISYSLNTSAQTGKNPFDLEHRYRVMMLMLHKDSVINNEYSNPFDVPHREMKQVASAGKPNVAKVKRAFVFTPARLKPEQFFGIFIALFLILAFVSATSRNIYNKILQAIKNSGSLNTFQREAKNFFMFPLFLLYIFWLFNLAIFLFFLARYYGIQKEANGEYYGLWLTVGIVFIAFICKHVIWYLSETFLPIKKQLSLYQFGIILINILLGLILFPINIFLLYLPLELIKITAYIGILAIIVMYLYRAFVGFLVAYKYILGNLFHFLLYFCTVELAPFVIILKYLANKSGI